MAALPLVMLLWANLHGGFVVGLGVVFLYAVASVFLRKRHRAYGVNGGGLRGGYFHQSLRRQISGNTSFRRCSIRGRASPEWRPLPLLAGMILRDFVCSLY